MLSWLSLRCGGAGWSATIQLGRAMAHATCFRGGQRRGKRGSGVWRCCGRVASVRMACFTHLIPLPWRPEPGRGTAGTWLVHRDRGEVEAAALDTKDGNGSGGR